MDMEKVCDSITTYSKSTGVECILINDTGKTEFKECPESQCQFCETFMKKCGMEKQCEKAHLYGAYQAERFGGVYIYFCPIGLVHWASPILADGIMKGAILGGHVLMTPPDKFLFEEIVRKMQVPLSQQDELKEFLDSIQVIPPTRVKHLGDMLHMVAEQLSDTEQTEEEGIPNFHQYIDYLDTMGGETVGEHCYPIEKEKILLARISLGDKKGASKVLNEILSYIFISYGNDFSKLKARILELVVLLSRGALEGGADVEQIFGLNYNYLNQISEFTTIDEVIRWISKILIRFTDCVFNIGEAKHADAIYKAMDFIKHNYMQKITLEEVARHVNFSPSYFCKIFKEEMNCNFNKYVKRIRVEMSKALLLDQELPIAEIALMVGFHDQSHYSKNFKSEVGVSPSVYRTSKGVRREVS